MDLSLKIAKKVEEEAETIRALPAHARVDAVEDLMFEVVSETGLYDPRVTTDLRFSKSEPTCVFMTPTDLMDDDNAAGLGLRSALGEVCDILIACMIMLEEDEKQSVFESFRTMKVEVSVDTIGGVVWECAISETSVLTSGFIGKYTSQTMDTFHPEVLARVPAIFASALDALPASIERLTVTAAQEVRMPKIGDPIREQILHVVGGRPVH